MVALEEEELGAEAAVELGEAEGVDAPPGELDAPEPAAEGVSPENAVATSDEDR
jgi:hypothetical protein